MKNEVLKKLLNGLTTNKKIIKIERVEHKQSFFVLFENIVKLKPLLSEFIDIIEYFYIIILYN
jgi:hypothetical protein